MTATVTDLDQARLSRATTAIPQEGPTVYLTLKVAVPPSADQKATKIALISAALQRQGITIVHPTGVRCDVDLIEVDDVTPATTGEEATP